MIVFYNAEQDGTLNNLSLDRGYDEAKYVDISKRDFIIAQHSLHECKIVDGKLVISDKAREHGEALLKDYYKSRVITLVRTEWSIDDEFDCLNARDEEPDKYAAYRAKVADLKAKARAEIYGNE